MSAAIIPLRQGARMHAPEQRRFIAIRIDADGKRHEATLWATSLCAAEDIVIARLMREGDRYLHVRDLRR